MDLVTGGFWTAIAGLATVFILLIKYWTDPERSRKKAEAEARKEKDKAHEAVDAGNGATLGAWWRSHSRKP